MRHPEDHDNMIRMQSEVDRLGKMSIGSIDAGFLPEIVH